MLNLAAKGDFFRLFASFVLSQDSFKATHVPIQKIDEPAEPISRQPAPTMDKVSNNNQLTLVIALPKELRLPLVIATLLSQSISNYPA